MLFIAIDGIDGAGKTTLALALQKEFEPLEVVITKEPTLESPWGQRLRQAAELGRLPKEQELEYFHQDRLYHIEHVIKPALERDAVVISDRYVDSMLAFQSATPSEADSLYCKVRDEIIEPDITFILSCPVEQALNRIETNRSGKTVFERQDTLEVAKKIYDSRSGKHYAHIDSSQNVQETLKQALSVIQTHFPEFWATLQAKKHSSSSSEKTSPKTFFHYAT